MVQWLGIGSCSFIVQFVLCIVQCVLLNLSCMMFIAQWLGNDSCFFIVEVVLYGMQFSVHCSICLAFAHCALYWRWFLFLVSGRSVCLVRCVLFIYIGFWIVSFAVVTVTGIRLLLCVAVVGSLL